MVNTSNTNDELLIEIKQLRLRLEEAESIVDAIRTGIVDAVVVHSSPKEAVYTLEGAKSPYRLLVEAMQKGVAVLNSQGVILYCNPFLAELFATSLQDITGSTIDRFSALADHSMFTSMLGNFDHTTVQKEVLLRRCDGTTFPAVLAVSTLPSQRFCLLISDLTQQNEYHELIASKAALEESEIRYRRLFETAKDGILILDNESGRITDANPFMGELLGYSHEQFLDKELWEIGLFSDKAANEAAVRTLQDQGYIRYEHLPLETNRGLRVEVEIIANSYGEGNHRVIQCNIRDITERSRLERLLREQALALEDLHHRKDEFLAMLSHELRNPLSPIVSALQLLSLQKNEDKLQLQARTIIERQVRQLTRLIDDLLEVSRITTGRIHIQQERVALNSIVEHAVETVRPSIVRHQHALTVSLSKEPIWLFADAARLEQVVVNLLTNAAKFTHDAGQIWLTVKQEGDECILRVKDNGIGIAPDTLPYVFDLFAQAQNSLDRSQGGLGIGLALVQRIVEMHKGRVEVSSTLAKGTEFIVHLPIMAAEVDQSSLRVDGMSPPNDHCLRVMVVDDNQDASQMLGMLLMRSGHEVLTVHDGPCSLIAVQDFRPDVMLLDIGLPGMDGFEVARQLRNQAIFKNVLLVAMTGYGQRSDRRRSKEAGFDHHLVKPIDFKILEQLLATAVEKRS